MVADLAIDVLRRHAPDLLLVHFLCADSHQHLYGPRSPEAYWAIAYIDGLIGRLLAALGPDGLDRTSVVVVSDHGFLPVSREVRPNVRLRRRGLLRLDAAGEVGDAEARFVMNHGAGWVYTAGAGDRERLARDLRAELAGLEGVAAVWTPEAYAELGLPTPAENSRAGDLLLEAAPGFMLSDEMRERGRDRPAPLPRHPRPATDVRRQPRALPRGRSRHQARRHAGRHHEPRRRADADRAARPAPGADRGPGAHRDPGVTRPPAAAIRR